MTTGDLEETPTQILHRLTSYEPGRDWDEPADDPWILQDLVTNDVDRLPYFFKRYDDGLPTIGLPRELPTTTASTVRVLAGSADVERRALDLAHLSRLLHLSAGVVRTMQRPYATWFFRAAGSAGGRFPLELYVSVPDGHDLPPGVHSYEPQAHALIRIGPPPRGGAPTIVITGVPWRTGWRYRERGYRHVYWDAGTMLAQLLALSSSAGHEPALRTTFPDAQVAELVGADCVHEWPVAVVSLGGEPAIHAGGDAAAGEVDRAPVEFPLVTRAQQAGDVHLLGDPWDPGAPVDVELPESPPLDEVVLRRGSQRLMDPTKSLPLPFLRTSMAAAMRGIAYPHLVAAHAVNDLGAGLYRWPDLAASLQTGSLRDDLYRICLEQELGSDAAFVVIAAAPIDELDDRGYRDAHLAAGLVEGRLHLLAYALGAAASGMTFDDSAVRELTGAGLDGVLLTCVGVPEYRSTAGGGPGAPVDVRQITPRTS